MSCTNNTSNINKTFIIGTPVLTGRTDCDGVSTNLLVSCSGDTQILLTSGATIFNTNLVPTNDNTLSVGTPSRRFRDLNSVSGTTSIWVATTRVETPQLHLGLDSSNNTRTITANNSVIQDDILFGGGF